MMPDVLSATLRALGFIAVLQAGGAVLFLALFGSDLRGARAGILRLLRLSATAAALLLLAQYLLEPARMAGALAGTFDMELQRFVLHTRAAVVLGLRLAGLAVLAWAARNDGARIRGFGVVGAVLIALSFPVTGHSAADPARAWLMPLLGLHLLVVEFWFGALLPLILVGRHESAAVAACVVARFSRVATWLVPLILAAGLVIAAILLPDVAALRGPYGLGLILKVVVFAALMGLAALNKWRLVPALQRHEAAARRALGRSIAVEFALIALVLMGTAILTIFWSPGM
jgi:putative copper resistance protein D